MSIHSGASTSIILRLELNKAIASFGQIATSISDAGGDMIAIDVNRSDKLTTVRDITVNVYDQKHTDLIVQAVSAVPGVKVIHVSDHTFLLHIGGKIEMTPKTPIKNRDDLSRVYTPGVAKVCMAIHEKKSRAHSLTIKRNMIAVVSDGSAVLGLGNIGPEAAMPVMEGKAVLFKQFAGVDAFPICLDTQDTEQIIQIVKAIAPNPTPEILPEEAEPYVRVMATGRSDYPNQINNVLCFPGIFRGILDCRASRVTEAMKLAAAKAIASVVTDEELNEHYIIPSVFNHTVVERVRDAVIQAAYESGVARKTVRPDSASTAKSYLLT